MRRWERRDKQQCGRVEACAAVSAVSHVKQTSPAQKKLRSLDLADNNSCLEVRKAK